MYCVNLLLLSASPFFDAFFHSDALGRVIFLSLIFLSILTWIIVIYKAWVTYGAKREAGIFKKNLHSYKGNILALESLEGENHYLNLYKVLKKQTVEILNKNKRFNEGVKGQEERVRSYLSPSDIDIVESHLATMIMKQTKSLEKNLYVLATVVPLAPFLGLLGTVWGILTTFGELQAQSGGNTNQMVLGGLSLALATTVLGLLDAIPALIGYNYLKNSIKEHQTDMECFSNDLLAAVEMQYRQVDVQ